MKARRARQLAKEAKSGQALVTEVSCKFNLGLKVNTKVKRHAKGACSNQVSRSMDIKKHFEAFA